MLSFAPNYIFRDTKVLQSLYTAWQVLSQIFHKQNLNKKSKHQKIICISCITQLCNILNRWKIFIVSKSNNSSIFNELDVSGIEHNVTCCTGIRGRGPQGYTSSEISALNFLEVECVHKCIETLPNYTSIK